MDTFNNNNTVKPMKKLMILGVAVVMMMAFGCKPGEPQTNTVVQEEKAEPVRTLTLDYQQIARTVEYSATLLAFQEIHLAPASPGRIEEIRVNIGDRVSKGQLLVQMDRTQLHQAEIQLRTLETDFRRLDTLRKTGSIAVQQYDQLKSQYEIARTNVSFLQENTKLTAPFSGVISGKYYEPGEMYSGAPSAPTGKSAILSIVQIDRLKVNVPISEKYFPLIRNGMEVLLRSDIYADKTFKGRIFNIYPTIDPSSRTFNVEVLVENTGALLRPGMFVRVDLDLDKVEAILLPAIAVLKLQGSNERYLFREEDGRARRVTVTIGKRYDDMIEVISDSLKQGDQVIVSGQARLLDGMKVSVQQD